MSFSSLLCRTVATRTFTLAARRSILQPSAIVNGSQNVCNISTTSAAFGKAKKYGFYITLGAGVGALYYRNQIINVLYSEKRESSVLIQMDESDYTLAEPPPKPERLASTFNNPDDKTGLKITLYQYKTCPFCCKVRAFLDYVGLSYDIVEVNSVTRKQTKWTKYRKVPFLVVDDQKSGQVYQLKDSTLIISSLWSYLNSKDRNLSEIMKYYPVTKDPKKKKLDIGNLYTIMYCEVPKHISEDEILDEVKWRRWVDDTYVHMLSPNVYRTFSESLQAFTWFAEAGKWKELFPAWEIALVHYVGSTVMYFIGKKLKTKYGLKDDVRQSFYDESNYLLKALHKKNTPFLGGDKPNLGDLGIYGVLNAIEGCDAFNDLLKNTNISSWFNLMRDSVKNHEGKIYL